MRKRYVYLWLFGIPGLFVAGIVAFMAFGAAAGGFWLFLFGDKEWPSFANVLLGAVFTVAFLLVWCAALRWAT